jgi:hypothetical protein
MEGHGLINTPTNFYNYAYWRKFESLKREGFCLNGRLISEIYFDQIKQFVETMNFEENKEKSFMSINILKMMTHDQFASARAFDTRFRDQLEEFKRKGFLDETLLIILGDHGGREYSYGNSVMQEFAGNEFNNPFLSIKLPDSMRNTLFFANFMENSAKLVTSFDLYKTLKHFSFLSQNGLDENEKACRELMSKSEPRERGLRGISLFEKVPANRSCSDALIAIGYCACNIKTDIDEKTLVSETGITSNRIGFFVLSNLTSITNSLRSKCVQYKFEKVIHVKSFMYDGNKFYEIKISVLPGPSHFRAIVKFERVLIVVAKIARENKYRNQSRCLITYKEAIFKEYCYCR